MEERFDLPENLKPLEELAFNLWFSWNPDARDLFKQIDKALWHSTERNPVEFLSKADRSRLEELNTDSIFLDSLNKVYDRFKKYMSDPSTRFSERYPNLRNELTAYFSAEYGIHESLPNYAGGLGILAGDHCKTASDLGLPFIAIGLMYKEAYFTQTTDVHGEQIEKYEKLDTNLLPVKPVLNEKGGLVMVSITILDREVYLKIWRAQVGRISLYLLDSNVEKNTKEDRGILKALYGGSRETRLQQEIILGIGGYRAVKKMGFNPSVYHMNEGHSVFLALERLAHYMNDGMNYGIALEMVRSTTLFTTHTPIPAGNEVFEFPLIESHFEDFWPRLGLTQNQFLNLGRNVNIHQHENFSLTVLALNLSYMANGVSALHGKVSRNMWQKSFPGITENEIPIGHVTNGIHTESWLYHDMIKLFDEYLGEDWREHIHDQWFWDKIMDIPDDVYWQTMQNMKIDMCRHLKRRYEDRLERYKDQQHNYPAAEKILDENTLTIGFARRFATYKRATLIFKDPERLKRILNDPEKPVQILFAGKAHPQNHEGKELIRLINQLSQEDGFRGKIVFIEGYTINASRSLVSGVDVWLNTPRRPLEASGTSGQKVPINGGVNFSVLDGWWPEGYNKKNGWAIGTEIELPDHDQQDRADSQSFYEILENDIVPKFYKRSNGSIPNEWIKISKESMRSVLTKFSTHTMVWNYVTKYYVPGIKRHIRYTEEEFSLLFKFTRWMNRIRRHWKRITLMPHAPAQLSEDGRIFSPGESREIAVKVYIDGLKPQELRVELILQRQDAITEHQQMEIYPMGLIGLIDEDLYEYRALVRAGTTGTYRFNCRVSPTHPDFFHPQEARLIKWLD